MIANLSRAAQIKSRRRKALKSVSVVLSCLLHVAIILLIFGGASGDLISAGAAGGGPTGPVFNVTLVRLASSAEAGSAAPSLQPLLMKVRAADVGVPVVAGTAKPSDAFTDLARRLRSEQPQPAPNRLHNDSRTQASGARRPSPAAPSENDGTEVSTPSKTSGAETGGASAGQLWGAVQPCWRRLGARGRVPVVLEVALNGVGDLRTPPRIIRSNTELIDERRLQAEASALAAVAACIPRGDLQFGGQTYRLEFPAGG